MPNVFDMPKPFPPRFAEEWGQDEHGIFMGFGVEHGARRIVQRMRWIPPGSFLMGSPENEVGRYDDEVQHPVELTQGYWLGDTVVTQALWEAVMGTNLSRFQGFNHPVEQVSWDDCQDFIKRLNARFDGLEARLPTEAEWEYACRAGTSTATWVGNLPAGQEIEAPLLDAIAWVRANAGNTTHPVAEKEPNPYGLYDMLGNVYEWCADGFAPYGLASRRDPAGPTQGAGRVFRGGSWSSDAWCVRAANRNALAPDSRLGLLGFRLARGPAPGPGSGAISKRGAPRGAESPRQGGAGCGTMP